MYDISQMSIHNQLRVAALTQPINVAIIISTLVLYTVIWLLFVVKNTSLSAQNMK